MGRRVVVGEGEGGEAVALLAVLVGGGAGVGARRGEVVRRGLGRGVLVGFRFSGVEVLFYVCYITIYYS